MSDRGLTWDEAVAFDRLCYIALLREIEEKNKPAPVAPQEQDKPK